jgi:inosose dehydratase
MDRTLIDRRTFTHTLALALGATTLPAWASQPVWAQGKKTLQIGHTGITWPSGPPGAGGRGRRGGGGAPGGGGAAPGAPGAAAPGGAPGGGAPAPARGEVDPGLAPPPATPRPVDLAASETIFKDVAGLGYHGLELFNWQIDGLERDGHLGTLIERYKLPLVASYTGMNLTDPAQRQSTIASAVNTAKILKKYGGKIIVVGPNGRGQNYVFADHRANIVTTLNEAGKAIADVGITAALHQHTGTTVETRDETYAIMEAVDTRVMKFGPDIGQFQKAGVDPVQVVKDFLPVIHHMHLKDWVGGEAMAGYCPLGQGKVNLTAILDMMEGRRIDGMVMVELDRGGQMPVTPPEAATIAKQYLQAQGYGFRA